MKKILKIMGLSFVICIVIMLIIKDPILEKIVEKSVSKKWGAAVQIDGFHLSLFRSSIAAKRIFVSSKKEKGVFFLTTGLFYMRFKVMPYILKRDINIAEVSLSDVNFGVENVEKDKNDLKQRITFIGLEQAVKDYIQNFGDELESITKIHNLITESDKIYSDVSKIVDNNFTIISKLEKDVAELQEKIQSLDSVSDILELRSVLKKSQIISKTASSAYKLVDEAYKKIANYDKTFVQFEHTFKNNLSAIIQDVDKISDFILDPKAEAERLIPNMFRSMLEKPISRYYEGILTLYDMLQEYEMKKNVINAGKNKNVLPYFTIGVFTIHVNNGNKDDFVSLQSKNINNSLYTSDKTAFIISSDLNSKEKTPYIIGEGYFSVNPKIPELFFAKLSYKRVLIQDSTFVNDIELRNFLAEVGGDAVIRLDKNKSLHIDSTSRIDKIKINPQIASDIGPLLSSEITKNQAIALTLLIDVDKNKNYSFDLESSILQKLATFIVEIVKNDIKYQWDQINTYTQNYITELARNTFAEIQVEALLKLEKELQKLHVQVYDIQNIAKKMSDLIQDQIKNVVVENIEKQKSVIKKNIDTVKDVFSF